MSGVAKMTQLSANPASAAVTEMKADRPGHDFVRSAITAAAASGKIKMNQGSALIIFIARESRE